MTIVTTEEIAKYRVELADYPEALEALDVIEECEGYVEDAIPLLQMRKTGHEPDRGLNDLLDKCRTLICQEEMRELIASGVFAPVLEPIAMSAGIPLGTATAISIFAFKVGLKKVCDTPNSDV